jgi:hypothetical protein
MSKNLLVGCAIFVVGLVLGADLKQPVPSANVSTASSAAATTRALDPGQMRAMVREELRSVIREELPADPTKDIYSHAMGAMANSATPAPAQVAQ